MMKQSDYAGAIPLQPAFKFDLDASKADNQRIWQHHSRSQPE
jgi:hypothetical protein